MKHNAMAARFSARPDRFSQLLAKAINDEKSGQALVTRMHLNEQEHAELLTLRDEANRTFATELVGSVARLREILTRGDPLHTVSMVQAMSLWRPWGTYYEPTEEWGEGPIELVASLVASQPFEDETAPPLESADMQELHDELRRFSDLSFLFNLSKDRSGDRDSASLEFFGTMHWLNLRGDSYADHGRDLAQAVFEPFDQWMVERFGFTVKDVIAVAEGVERLTHRSMNNLGMEAAAFANRVASELDDPSSVSKLHPELQARLDNNDARFHLIGRAFFEVFDNGIRDAATFDAPDVHEEVADVDPRRIDAVLSELSVDVGGVDATAYRGPFDPSPLVDHPFLHHDGLYILPVPGMLIRDTFKVLDDRLMTGRPGYSNSRAATLDRLAVSHLLEVLPGATGYVDLHYEHDSQLDGLVLFENIAFVVEGKGSAISFKARRGDVARLVNEMKRSVEEAAAQGIRARDFLLSSEDAVFRYADGSEMVRVAPGSVKLVHIINPTIHELGGFAPQLARFRSSGLFADGELPWSIYIQDLRVIAELCDNPAVFLHYLAWRSRLPLGEQIVAQDELDLWGAYLFGARFPPLDDDGTHFVGNSTTDFDAYYDGLQGRAPKQPKPRKYTHQPIEGFIERMARERPDGWIEAAAACLEPSIPEMAFICAKSGEIARLADDERDYVEIPFSRGVVIGVPRTTRDIKVVEHAQRRDVSTANFYIYVRQAGRNKGEIVWATPGDSIDLELSDFEKTTMEAIGMPGQPDSRSG